MEKICCPRCDNHCKKDALLCDNGREEFGLPLLKKKKRQEIPSENPLFMLLRCGHMLHHGLLDDLTADRLVAALLPQEQAELHRLLTILAQDWQKQLPQEAKK